METYGLPLANPYSYVHPYCNVLSTVRLFLDIPSLAHPSSGLIPVLTIFADMGNNFKENLSNASDRTPRQPQPLLLLLARTAQPPASTHLPCRFNVQGCHIGLCSSLRSPSVIEYPPLKTSHQTRGSSVGSLETLQTAFLLPDSLSFSTPKVEKLG
jgi:hypothetical protein